MSNETKCVMLCFLILYIKFSLQDTTFGHIKQLKINKLINSGWPTGVETETKVTKHEMPHKEKKTKD